MRITERAQRAVLYAKGEASRLGHDRVGTEHLLLALLRDQECLAVATLTELGIAPETVRRRVEETVGRGQMQHDGYPSHLPTTKPFTLALTLAGREAMELEHDRAGTEHLLLGLAREGEGVAARVLQESGAGLLELGEAVAARYAAGVDPEPFPPDRGPPPWEPPPGARLRRVVPLAQGASAAVGRPAGAAVAGGLVGLVGPALRGGLRHPRAGGRAATAIGDRRLRVV
jgi:hypothetical protein